MSRLAQLLRSFADDAVEAQVLPLIAMTWKYLSLRDHRTECNIEAGKDPAVKPYIHPVRTQGLT